MSLGEIDFDGLGSFDGSDTGIKSPRSPRSPQVPYYNPIGLTIGATSPSPSSPNRSVASSGAGSYAAGRNQAHSIHGVHMHVQENAKVPLLNQPVDRSNSGSIRRSYLSSSQPEDRGFSMAELFLNKESKNRQSVNMNYAGLGTILDDFGFSGAHSNGSSRRPSGDGSWIGDSGGVGGTTSEVDEAQLEIDALTAAIDPTPWSEIERRMHKVQESASANISRQQPAPINPPHRNPYNYYQYERSEQLPIPGKSSPPPTQQHATAPPPATSTPPPPLSSGAMAQALATAAALASVEIPAAEPEPAPPPSTRTPSAPPPTATVRSHIGASALPYTRAQQTTPAAAAHKPRPPAQQYQRQRATYSAPQHAVAHSTSRASVLAATTKKSQYGFGGNHVVPSVPAPPPTATTRAYNKDSKLPESILPSLSDEHSHNNSGAAYERKKQRAKDARIKLNDAIERLSIAMNMAGSQSKQRANLLGSRIGTTEQRPKSLQISEECAKLAEQAKKWDRPSFVATAASLVQALNSQCESLSREMVCLQERLDATTGTTSGVPGSVPLPPTCPEPTTSVTSGSQTAGTSYRRCEWVSSQANEIRARNINGREWIGDQARRSTCR